MQPFQKLLAIIYNGQAGGYGYLCKNFFEQQTIINIIISK
jgi:hypothetical protein